MMGKYTRDLLKTYRESTLAKIGSIFFTWLLLLSFWYSYEGLADFVPVLWKPIPPFEGLSLTNLMMQTALWAWRVSLVMCIILPSSLLSLTAATLFGFFCLGIRSCFGLQPQLFASLELTLLSFLIYSLIRRERVRGEEIAFIVKLIAVLLFFSAGLSKLRWSGPSWPFSSSLAQSLEMLYPLNRPVVGYPWVLDLRQKLLEIPLLIQIGSAVVLVFELLSPIALFSKLGSRVILFSACIFILSNLVFFGIIFYTIFPLLLIWGLWNTDLKQFAKLTEAKTKQQIQVYTFLGVLIFSQLGATIFASKNLWPIMLNDMYARPAAFPPVTDFEFKMIMRDGSTETIDDNTAFAPFSKFHIAIALIRLKDRPSRDALLEKVLTNYQKNNCSQNCTQLSGVNATWTQKGGGPEVLANWSAP